jgi:glutamine synthetase
MGAGHPPLAMVLCDGLTIDGEVWDSCTLGFCKAALADLKHQGGLCLNASPELDFQLIGSNRPPATPFSLEAFRLVPDIAEGIATALRQAGTEPEAFEPEHGVGQYEVSCKPAVGIAELPTTLAAAPDCLKRDKVMNDWFPPNLWRTCLAVKRKEIDLMANLSDEEICERYRNAD